jgi:hypothetical protein
VSIAVPSREDALRLGPAGIQLTQVAYVVRFLVTVLAVAVLDLRRRSRARALEPVPV